MASYYLNEAVLELPHRPFVDKTIHGLESKLPDGQTLGVLVHRRPLDGAGAAPTSLEQLVDDHVALNQKRLSAFAVLERTPAAVGGLPGILLRTRWRKDSTVYCQLQAQVIFDHKLMIVAVTSPISQAAACDETFASILATISWRSD